MPNASLPARRGRTLAELLVTLTVSGILFALLTSAFIGHERLVSGSTAIAELRSQMRQAHQIVPALLRAVADSDLFVVHDTLAEFGYPIASGVVCVPSAPNQLVLAPDSIANGQRFAAWTHMPRPGDAASVFDPGPLPSATDDRWWRAAVGNIATAPNGCSGSPLLDAVVDAIHTARVVSIGSWAGGASPSAISAGAVVVFTRRTRAKLYTSSGSDYLGISDYDPTTSRWSVVQPLSGPYASRPGAPSAQFQLLDSLGAQLPLGAAPPGASTVTLRVRSQTAAPVRITGMRRGARAESLATHTVLHNR